MATEYIRIRNWEKWQTYRKDRGQPSWIKVHRDVMRNPEWVQLTDAQRGQLVAIWLLAADRAGAIPASPRIIQKLCFMDSEPDLQLFTDLGFIEPGNQVVTTCQPSGDQAVANVTPQSREEKSRVEERDDVDARARANQLTTVEDRPGLPPEAASLACVEDATDKQLEEIARLGEVTGVPPEDMLAKTIHATWTKRSASVVIDRYADIIAAKKSPKTFLDQKLQSTDEAFAAVMQRMHSGSNQ